MDNNFIPNTIYSNCNDSYGYTYDDLLENFKNVENQLKKFKTYKFIENNSLKEISINDNVDCFIISGNKIDLFLLYINYKYDYLENDSIHHMDSFIEAYHSREFKND